MPPMKHAELQSLMARHRAMPFPPDCRGRAIDGIELVLVGADVYGAGANFLDNDGSVTSADAAYLSRTVPGLERIIPKLPHEEAMAYYRVVLELGKYLLAVQPSRDIRER